MNANAQPTEPELRLSDTELVHMAQSALAWNSALPPGAVRASATAGWLTLSGEVLWHYQRQDAGECVRYLPGLAGICNDITLRSAMQGLTGPP
jgi:osmotically-inducible protein OsmY